LFFAAGLIGIGFAVGAGACGAGAEVTMPPTSAVFGAGGCGGGFLVVVPGAMKPGMLGLLTGFGALGILRHYRGNGWYATQDEGTAEAEK
jgi:hypothetical protein